MWDVRLKDQAGSAIARDKVLAPTLQILDEEFDLFWADAIDRLDQYLLDPDEMPNQLLEPMARSLVAPPSLAVNYVYARKKVKSARAISRMRCTYDGLLASLLQMGTYGFDLVNVDTKWSLDSAITLDHQVRRLDSNRCAKCITVDIDVTGPALPSDATEAQRFLNSIGEVVQWHLPIFTKLRTLSYNGDPFTPPVLDGAYSADFANTTAFS